VSYCTALLVGSLIGGVLTAAAGPWVLAGLFFMLVLLAAFDAGRCWR
jgi:hypothetical protein